MIVTHIPNCDCPVCDPSGVRSLNKIVWTGGEEMCGICGVIGGHHPACAAATQETRDGRRRCPTHPDVVIGSSCGTFDTTCGKCEFAADEPVGNRLLEDLKTQLLHGESELTTAYRVLIAVKNHLNTMMHVDGCSHDPLQEVVVLLEEAKGLLGDLDGVAP